MKVTAEEFEGVGTTKLDTKKRVTLGAIFKILRRVKALKDVPIETFETFIGNEGDILLRPRVSIPARELWVHQNPAVMKSIQRGMRDIKEGRVTKVKNLDKFFKEL